MFFNAIRTAYTLIFCALLYDHASTRRSLTQKSLQESLQETTPYIFEFYFLFACIANLTLIYLYQNQPREIIYLILTTQCSDVLQYYIGSSSPFKFYIGFISPRKTWEGYIGATAVIMSYLLLKGCSSMLTYLIYIILGAAGGLLASYVKRTIGVKDYSNLLGPHGGYIDRTDSIYLPVMYLYIRQWI